MRQLVRTQKQKDPKREMDKHRRQAGPIRQSGDEKEWKAPSSVSPRDGEGCSSSLCVLQALGDLGVNIERATGCVRGGKERDGLRWREEGTRRKGGIESLPRAL